MNATFKLTILNAAVCIASSLQAEGTWSGLARLDFFGSKNSEQMHRYFEAIMRGEYGSVYEFGSDGFKHKISREWFVKQLSDWQLKNIDILLLSSTVDSGFYMMMAFEDDSEYARRYTVQFWKIENGIPRFLHFPFPGTGVPDTMSLTPLYKHN